MDEKLNLLYKGIKNPAKAVRYVFALVDNKFKLTEKAKARGGGERLVIKNWQSVKKFKRLYNKGVNEKNNIYLHIYVVER